MNAELTLDEAIDVNYDNEETEENENVDDNYAEGYTGTNSVKIYLDQIRNFDLLTSEEEVDLSMMIASGDEASLKKLVESNLRLVVSIAKKYHNTSIDFLDLIQEGNQGLIEAAKRFNGDLGYRFSTYATPWIKRYISKAIFEQTRNIRIPGHIITALNKMKKAEWELTNSLQREPSNAEIAKAMGLTEKEVEKLKSYIADTSSLDVQVGEEEDSTLGSLIEDGKAVSPERACIEANVRAKVCDCLSTLPEREAKILRYRFGIGGVEPMTLEQVGAKLNLTKERVRQIENKALRALRTNKAFAAELRSFID